MFSYLDLFSKAIIKASMRIWDMILSQEHLPPVAVGIEGLLVVERRLVQANHFASLIIAAQQNTMRIE